MNLTDGQLHDLELYLVDWDSTSRSETVTIQQRLDGRGAGYRDGRLVPLGRLSRLCRQRRCECQITHVAGANAVLSGLFLDPSTTVSPLLFHDTFS